MITEAPRGAPRSPATTRAGITLLLSAAMAVSILPGFCIGVLAASVLTDLRMTRAELGIVAAMFSGVTALASVWFGRLSDQLGGRAVLLISFGLGAVTFVGIAASPTFAVLLVATVIGGLSQAAANPATNRVMIDALGAGRRGLLTGVKQSGEMVAIVVAGALIPVAAAVAGWRGAVALAALIPIAGGAATLRLVPPGIPAGATANDLAGNPASDAGHVPRDVWWLTGYALLMGLSGGAVATYLPLYAQERIGVSVTTAGLVLAIMGIVAIPGRIVWSTAAEHTSRYIGSLLVLSGLGVAGALSLWAAGTAGEPLLWTGALLWGLSQLSFGAVSAVAVMAFAAPGGVGRATGILLVGFSLGLMLGPIAFGFAADATAGYDLGFAWVTSALVGATITTIAWLWRRMTRS